MGTSSLKKKRKAEALENDKKDVSPTKKSKKAKLSDPPVIHSPPHKTSGKTGVHSSPHKTSGKTEVHSSPHNTSMKTEVGRVEPTKVEAIKVEPVKTEPVTVSNVEMTLEQQKTLIAQMKNQLPGTDIHKYETGERNLRWDLVAFENFTPDMCKLQWRKLQSKIRHFRTLTELVHDVEQCWSGTSITPVNKRINLNLPPAPKRPLTPYFRFFVDKQQKFKAAHPDLSTTEISKLLSEKYKDLSERKKKKYHDDYNREKVIYDGQYKQYCLDNHIASVPKASKKPAMVSAVGLYIDQHIEARLAKEPHLLKSDLKNEYKKIYANLPDKEKVPYIQKAMDAHIKYEKDMSIFCEQNPLYRRPTQKSCLTKDELRIKNVNDGKPGKPPANGYGLFTSEKIVHFNNIPNSQRMIEVGKLWKNLSEEEKSNYTKKAKKKMQEYRETYETYLKGLSTEERELILKQTSKVKDRKIGDQTSANEHVAVVPSGDILSKRRKKRVYFQGEPKKPIGSGYQLFSSEMLSKLPEIKSNLRMAEIAKQWHALSDSDKDVYNQRRQVLFEKYLEELAVFKKTLSAEDLQKYDKVNTPKKVKKAKIKQKQEKPTQPTSDSESSSDSDDSESSSDDSSDDDESSSSNDDSSSSGESSSDDSDSGSSSDEDSSSDDDDDEPNTNGVQKEKSVDTKGSDSSSDSSDSESDESSESEDSSDEE